MGFATVQKVLAAPDARAIDEAASPALAEALDCLRVALTIYDSQQRLIYANQHFDYLFRAMPGRETLMGMSYGDLVRLEIDSGEIAPEALTGGVAGFVAQRRAQLNDGDFHPFDIALADGRIIEIKSRRTQAGGWIVLWSDATQARHAMNRLENAIELSADAFAFFDRNDRLVVCNKDFAALHGRGADALRGKDFRTVMTEAVARGRFVVDGDKELWLQRCIDLHQSPAGAMTLESKTGGAFLVRERATQGGGRVTVMTDITDERRVEAALADTRQALASSQSETRQQASYLADLTRKLDAASSDADTTKKTLLRTMSHELKTPLNAIIGFSDLLIQMGDRFGPEQIKEYAGLIHAGGHNLLRMLNHILDLTKLAAGKYELRRARLDAGGAMWIAADGFAEKAAARNIIIDADACPVGLLVDADENAFGQMLHQLIGNAVAFTPPGGRIVLSARAGGGRVQLCVSDNGPGVNADDMARILLPFEQAGRGTTDHASGAGLGLTLTKAFAELHGGSLTIANGEDGGFRATITLPAAD